VDIDCELLLPRNIDERSSDGYVAAALSILLHAALIGALVYGFLFYRETRPTPTLAIEATVVDARALSGVLPKPTPPAPKPQPQLPAPAPEPVEPTGPAEPSPEELAQREQAAKDQAAKEHAAKEEAERQQAEKERAERQQLQLEAQQRAQAQKQAEQKRLEQQRQRETQEKAEAERKAAEARKREEQRLAEQRRAEAAQREADARALAEREADLKSDLEAEARAAAARNSGALASWQQQIAARIQRAWLRPNSARSGIQCVLHVTQVPGGVVTNVQIGSCNGDQAVRESIEAAAYRASPLPPPPDPSLFERNLEITFKPD
jgi:colicin import membrane protein